ncbi:MAG: histidine--tRNA ligase [Candidatus Wolfebacteria bacterium]|nr:histidine--tRNA ligase [Candidatus Wolfebacteria bacterium]
MAKTPVKTKKVKISEKTKKGAILLQAPKGMHDILPEDQPWWNRVRKVADTIADFYNFQRIDTPILENMEIFERGVGNTTDIVEKEMFVARTKGGDQLVLRPENTAGIMRAYLEHGLSRLPQPLKLYYLGPFFRHERPQAGRYRQFHQGGFEIIGGDDDPLYDAQIILATYRFIEELKVKNLVIQINSIGCRVCRPTYKRKLLEYYKKFENKLCKDCRRRIEINPLRLLDCKNESCEALKADAPVMVNHLCSACRNHFKLDLEYLDELGLPYALSHYLVRGLDYYNRTVFEIYAEGIPSALGGGGRYDYLAEILGGRKSPLPAVGSAPGIERIIEVMKAQGVPGISKPRAKIFLIQIGDPAKKKALGLLEKFREADIKVIESLGKESLSTQLKIANKEEVQLALLLGQREVFEDNIIIRDMKSGNQETVPLSKVVDEVKRRL